MNTRSVNGQTFVEVNLNDEWVCKVLTGKGPRSTAGGGPESTFIHRIVSQIEKHEGALEGTPTKEAPLDDLDAGFGGSPSSASGPALAGPRAGCLQERQAAGRSPRRPMGKRSCA